MLASGEICVTLIASAPGLAEGNAAMAVIAQEDLALTLAKEILAGADDRSAGVDGEGLARPAAGRRDDQLRRPEHLAAGVDFQHADLTVALAQEEVALCVAEEIRAHAGDRRRAVDCVRPAIAVEPQPRGQLVAAIELKDRELARRGADELIGLTGAEKIAAGAGQRGAGGIESAVRDKTEIIGDQRRYLAIGEESPVIESNRLQLARDIAEPSPHVDLVGRAEAVDEQVVAALPEQ